MNITDKLRPGAQKAAIPFRVYVSNYGSGEERHDQCFAKRYALDGKSQGKTARGGKKK